MQDRDRVYMEVVVDSMRLSLQTALSDIFKQRETEMRALVEQTIKNFDWNKAITKQLDDELNRHARAFTDNSMRFLRNDHARYSQIQKECDALVKARLTQFWLDEEKKQREADNK